MSYYWCNRQELLQKAKEKYHICDGDEKTAEYYLQNKDVTKVKANNKYKNLSEEEKETKRRDNKDRYEKMKEKLSYFLVKYKNELLLVL